MLYSSSIVYNVQSSPITHKSSSIYHCPNTVYQCVATSVILHGIIKLPAENAEVQETLQAIFFHKNIILPLQNTHNLYKCHNGSSVLAKKLENKLILQVFD
jgi:hypothetical protein